jgi:hypothetical protein
VIAKRGVNPIETKGKLACRALRHPGTGKPGDAS